MKMCGFFVDIVKQIILDMKKYLFIVLCIVLFTCCKKEVEESLFKTYYIEDVYDQPEKIVYIDSISSGIKVIPLETSNDVLIMTIAAVYLYNNFLFVIHESSCSVFDMDGNYLRDIGRRGNGPGEYTGIWELCFQDEFVFIHDIVIKKLFRYTLDGEFINAILLSDDYEKVQFVGNNVLIGFLSIGHGDKMSRLKYIDLKGAVIDSIPNYKIEVNSQRAYSYLTDCSFFVYNHSLRLKEGYNDTVFTIRLDGKLIPEYAINTGTYSVNYEDRILNNDKYYKGKNTVIIFENNQYLILDGLGLKSTEYLLL
jgi:hypothetical protein